MAERFVYRFAWDPEKATANRGKHGVIFEQPRPCSVTR
jgi:uncharacterized DUF497 family protein